MTTLKFFIWAFLILVILAIGLLVSKFAFRKKKGWMTLVFALVEGFLTLVVAYYDMVVWGWFTWTFGFPLAALYIVLAACSISNFVTWIAYLVMKRRDATGINLKLKTILTIALTVIIGLLGTVNMETVVPNSHTYSSDKLDRNYKIIAISDLHFGGPQPESVVKKMLADIKAEKPDMILLAGDLTDEFTEKNEMIELYEMIGELHIPVYMVYGNHDKQDLYGVCNSKTYSEKELAEAITSNGIRILKDDVVEIGDDLSILGREDMTSKTREPVEDLPLRDRNRYQITVDHQPYSPDDIIETGADLQISGHSHAGQLFPLEQIYNLAGFDSYGEYHYGNTLMYVSSGAAGWMFPLRTAERSNYEVFNLKRK